MTEAARAPAHDTLIQESWSRCRDYGLTHQSSPRFDPPPAGELSALLESRQALVQTTHQEVLPYYGTILSNSNCLIMLADEQKLEAELKAKGMTFVDTDQSGFAKKAKESVLAAAKEELKPTIQKLYAD